MSDLDSGLNVKLVDQDELESSLTTKANDALIAKENELDEKRLQKTTQELDKVQKKVSALETRLKNPRTKISLRRQLKDEIEWFQENEIAPLLQDVKDIKARLEANRILLNGGGVRAMEGESERDFLIRTGKITAFGTSTGFLAANGVLAQSLMNLRAPGFHEEDTELGELGKDAGTFISNGDGESLENACEIDLKTEDLLEDDPIVPHPRKTRARKSMDRASDDDFSEGSEIESDVDDLVSDYDSGDEIPVSRRKRQKTAQFPPKSESPEDSDLKFTQRNVDDGDEEVYQQRLQEWIRKRSKLRLKSAENDNGDEWRLPHPTIPDAVLNENFRLPGDVFPSLFDYQKTCVQWLWELYSQKTGGIIGDEMGLGKTIQVIAFLAGLHYSGLLEKPVLLVVPATVMNQWVNEFHRWWPPLRCVILHSIGSGMTKSLIRSEEQLEDHLEQETADSSNEQISMRMANNQVNAKEIVDRVMEKGHVLVTTYVGLRIYSKYILPREWGYVVLDEGHKIRNPNLEISLACKRVKTHNRVILSGTPIQNNLIELWSLFDFVFPGRLGTLPVFEQQFAVPINMGGYANASNVQVQTGYKCAVILRDLISPYLLRRLKVDVAQDLPKKNEMVLFVRLTQFQQDMYERFLGSEDVGAILKGRRNVLMGVDTLRKICNHPDLVDRELLQRKRGYHYGEMAKLGKMVVLKNLLQLWQSQGHRTLLFCQTKQMLDILERFVEHLPQLNDESHFNYLRMDGSTPIVKRQQLVDTFNTNTYFHVFLLTTKVGGLGVNLTGADRVIIFDPDWNPSTDLQARERAWRLGQKKDITIYRLMTAGTIEEKIYHRQIFKTFLTNKILKDPKQRRYFKLNDLHDLFSLGDPDERGTETGDMFNGSEQTFGGDKARKSTRLLHKEHKNDDDFYQVAQILGVSKLDKFAGEEEPLHENEDEDRIMEGIFSNAGVVHSTLKHDEVVDSLHQEVSLVEREASRVAKEAAEKLKHSRMLARRKAIGTPTWTGKFGTAGRFGPQGQKKHVSLVKPGSMLPPIADPLSSSSILQNLRLGKASLDENLTGNQRKPKAGLDKEQLLKHLVDYLLAQHDHFSKLNAILQALPKSVDSANERQMVMVRSLLREAADWVPEKKGWKLKLAFEEKDKDSKDLDLD